jgi:hypothetical protein
MQVMPFIFSCKLHTYTVFPSCLKTSFIILVPLKESCGATTYNLQLKTIINYSLKYSLSKHFFALSDKNLILSSFSSPFFHLSMSSTLKRELENRLRDPARHLNVDFYCTSCGLSKKLVCAPTVINYCRCQESQQYQLASRKLGI